MIFEKQLRNTYYVFWFSLQLYFFWSISHSKKR